MIPPSDGPVVITVSSTGASVDARHADLVAPALETECVAWAGAGGTVTGRVGRQWHGRRVGANYVFPSKLAPLIAGRLHVRGIACDIRGFRPRSPAGWDAAGPGVRDLLGDRRLAGLGGLVVSGRGRDPKGLIPDLLRLFRGVRAVVATRNRDGIRHWHRYLPAVIDRPVVRVREEHRLWRGRDAVLVCSLHALDRLCRADDFGLVVVPDVGPLSARPSAAAAPTYPTLRDPNVPAFGFTARSPEQLSAAEGLTLGSYFGRVLHPPETRARVRVSVAASTPTENVPDELVAAKRAVWADPTRNARTARLAATAAAEPGRSVAVLTGAPVHAAELARLLDGWAVVSPDVVAPLPDRAIVTEGWLARGHRFDADAVIDARGWGPLSPADFLPAAEVLLVDVPAAGHPAFVARTADRSKRYAGYGWPIGRNHSDVI